MHFAIALNIENEISEEDVHILHAGNPFTMCLLSEKNGKGYTPIRLLCTQKRPNVSLMRKMCLRDPKAFVLRNHNGQSTLHMVA